MCTKGNPNFFGPTILSHSNNDSCLGSSPLTGSREELFDSSLNTVNVSVNTELPMDFPYDPKEEEFDFLHFYGEMSDDDFHRMMSVDDLTYSIAFSDEVFDNGEWHTYVGLETCNVIKSTRHGKKLLGKSIQIATERGDSGTDNLSGDDTKLGTDQPKADVYESSNNMSVGSSIGENQIQSDSDLEDDLSSLAEDDDIFSDSYDGAYISADESLEGTLDASFKSIPCTVVSSQEKHSLTDLDPSAALRSSEIPGPSDKLEDVDLGSCCVFNELPVEPCDNEVILSSPIGFVGSSTDEVDYAKDFQRSHSTLEHLDALNNLSNNLLSHSVVRPSVLKKIIEHVKQQLAEKYTNYELVITEVHDYYNIPVSSFDYVDGILGVFVPLFIRPNLQEPMYVYNVKTIPVPYHINAEMEDETENENAYTQIIPDTEMVAMNRDTYINVDQSELKQCIKFSVMYFCEQTFLMKHTSEHTCETAIYHEQSPDLIKDKCNVQYYPELNPTPQILDAGKHVLLGNIPEPWSVVCSKNDPIPNPLESISRRKICVSVPLAQVHVYSGKYCSL